MKAWTPDQVESLFILHEVLEYSCSHCAYLMEREFKRPVTKSGIIGLYNREKAKGYQLSPETIAEVEQAAELQ